VSRLPNSHLSFLDGLNMPKYRAVTQCRDLFGWVCLAHFEARRQMWASSLP
jgi:hypothetical protein